MESKAVGFCAVVAVLGTISAATGYAAEVTIRYESSRLGIVSAVFAIMTQAYISVAFGGCRCCRNDPNSTPVSKLLTVLSWVATLIAVVLLLARALFRERLYMYPGIFEAGATLALLSAVFGIAAYVTVVPAATRPPRNPTVAIPMGFYVDPEKGPVPFPPPQPYPPQ